MIRPRQAQKQPLPPRRRSLALLLAALALCVGSLFPSMALADDVADEADVQFGLGAERYQAGDFTHALAYFLASNRLARNRNVLFNIARCYEQLKQFPEAHRYYSRALDGETDASAISRTTEAISRISPHVAILQIVSDPPGAKIYLDRKDLGERGTAPQKLALPPATYRVVAELEGWEDALSEPVEIVIGAERSVQLRLRRIVGTIRVSGPPGAELRLDADNTQVICRAPCDAVAPPGQHTVILSKQGYRTVRLPVSVAAQKVSSIQPDLVPETGSLVVNADERDAAIEVDGATLGFTPAILNVPVGPHRVRVSLRGFVAVERDVLIQASRQTHLEVQLISSDAVEAASRVTESVDDAPASVSLISSLELRAMRYPTLAEALRGVRGVYTSDDRGYEALGFRGFSRPGAYGNRVLITMDGVPLNDDWIWSSYVGSDLRTDLEDIDRIEVVRGPGSVLYGTSAFSGVVNLVTRSRDVPTSREVGLSVSGAGAARARARITQRFGSAAGVWASLAAGRSEGREFFFPEYVADGPSEVAGNSRGADGARYGTLTGRAWWKDISLAWSLHHHDKRLPTGQFETLLGDQRTHQADTRGFVEARAEPKIGQFVTSLTRLHANLYTYRGFFARAADAGGVEYNKYDSVWGGVEQRFVLAPSSAFTASVGGELQTHPDARQRGGTETEGQYQDDSQNFVLGAVYATVDARPIKDLKVSAGGRFDYYSREIVGTDTGEGAETLRVVNQSFNPRLALIARPYEGGNLKIIAGKAFKAPSVYEYSYNGVGQVRSENLKPENAYSAEIELSQRIGRSITGTASVFSNYVTDLISLEPGPPGPDGEENIRFENTDTPVGTYGVEFELRREWREGWMVAGSYSFQRSQYLAQASLSGLLEFQRSAAYREVPNAPEHLASLRAAVPILSRALSLMTRVSFEGPRYDTNDRVDLPTQSRTESGIFWDFVFSGSEARWGINYSLGVYNAFDSRARYPVSNEFRQRTIPVTGRSLLAAASVTF